MNVKYRACMNRKIIIIAAALCIALPLSSRSYERTVARNLWNDGSNVTGIRQDSISVAFAELKGSYAAGSFRAYSDAVSAWSAGASTAAIRHLDRFSLAGSFGFTQTQGESMCGSMFIEPGKYPFDVLEFTPGAKTRQSYAFNGGISIDLTGCLRVGFAMDFQSQNYSKRKDLRYESYALDMEVLPALMYHSGDFALGVNYIFRKTSEAPKAEQIGTTVASYYAFLDKGLFYGVNQIWDGSGVHLSESGVNGFPVSELFNGAAVQFAWKDVYADFEFSSRSGKAGEKQFVWCRFPGYEMRGRISWKHESGFGTHYLRISGSYLHQDNNETVLERVTEGGVTTITEHGFNRLFTRNVGNAALRYELVAPLWSVRAGAGTTVTNSLSSAMYPFLYGRSVTAPFASVGAELRPGNFELRLDASARKGFVSESERSVSATSGVTGLPYRNADVMEWQDEFDNAFRSEIGLALRYIFKSALYLQLEAGWTHAYELKKINGSDRITAGIGIGYEF